MTFCQHKYSNKNAFSHVLLQVLASEVLAKALVLVGVGRRAQGERKKVKIALRVRAQTRMSLEWLARRLKTGTKTQLSHLLHGHGREKWRDR